MGTAMWLTGQQLLTELNILSARDPAITLLGVCPKENKNCAHTETFTQCL